MNLEGKVVVITGASSGIGAAAAAEFSRRKARVVMISRDEERLNRARVPGAEIMPCDVSSSGRVSETARSVLDGFGRVDILVNNAGFAVYDTVSRTSVGDMEAQMGTNYFGMVYCTKAFLPGMLERDSGHVVNVASAGASVGMPGLAAYCASKFAILGFSEALRHELHGTGVGVTVVSPIGVRTNFFDHPSFGGMKEVPLSISPQRVARAIVGASSSRRLEIMVPEPVRCAVWLKQTLPYLLNPLLGRQGRRMYGSSRRSALHG